MNANAVSSIGVERPLPPDGRGLIWPGATLRVARLLGRATTHPGLWIALLTLLLYLPSSARIVQLSPDMVEHVDIARRLARGEGYLLGIKAYHLGGADVVEDGLLHRPPLLTLGLAGLFALGQDLQTAQAFHSVVGALCAALVYSVGRHLFGLPVGIGAGVLAATCPFAFKVELPLMTEGVSALLILTGVRISLSAVERRTLGWFLFAGVAFGLGYLARPPVLAVFVAVLLASAAIVRDRRDLPRAVGGLLAGAALIVVPMSLFSLLTRGRLLYSGKGYLYAVVSDRTVIEEGLSTTLPSPAEFVWANADYIRQTIVGLAYTYFRWIFFDPEWLLPLLPGWPVALVLLARGRYPRALWIPLAAAGANYVFYSLTWASWQDRFMLPTLLLLLPLGVDGLFHTVGLAVSFGARRMPMLRLASTWSAMVFATPIAAITLYWFPAFTTQYQGSFAYFDRPTGTRIDAGIRWTGPPRWVNDDDFKDVVAWLRTHTTANEVVAAGQPWPLGLFTDRPTVLVPINLGGADLRKFVIDYRVSYLLQDGRDPRRRSYRDYLDDVDSDTVRATRVGAVTIVDTRALWR